MKTHTLIAAIALTALGVTLAARADVVTDWNNAALDAIRADRTPPPKASRFLAILDASIFDSVNGIARTHESYFEESGVPASASQEAAASAAARAVFLALVPAHTVAADRLH